MLQYPFPEQMRGDVLIEGLCAQTGAREGTLYFSADGAVPADYEGPVFCERRFCPACPGWLAEQARARAYPSHPVFLDARTSGGSFSARLRLAKAQYGGRLWVWLTPMAHVFPIPCPDGEGAPVCEAQKTQMLSLPGHESEALMCRYAFFLNEQEQPQMFLYDTPQTLRKKLQLLQELELEHVFGSFTPLAP